ncbi:hypothetical protein LTR15_011282 [Elasticomyces elasticus]|nr:hypothetical protein LTR15_011282 [Elasticomyces elasticus]
MEAHLIGNTSKLHHKSKSTAADHEQLRALKAELASLPLVQRLQRLTIVLFHTVNEREWDSPILSTFMSSTFKTEGRGYPAASLGLRETYINALRENLGEGVIYDHHITTTCAEVDEDREEATVWATVRTTILPYGHLVQETWYPWWRGAGWDGVIIWTAGGDLPRFQARDWDEFAVAREIWD